MKRFSGGQSCSKLMESIRFMIWVASLKSSPRSLRRAYNMGLRLRSKKMAVLGPESQSAATGHLASKMIRIGRMASATFSLNRRELMAGLSATALSSTLSSKARAQTRPSVALQARTAVLALRPDGPAAQVWSLVGPDLRFRRGETLEVTLSNDLPVPTAPYWRGIAGMPSAEPLMGRPPIPAEARESFQIPLRYAGTFLCDLRLLGDGQARPSRVRALIVTEKEPVAVGRDEILLIEDWRLRANGTAMAPGTDPRDATPVYTINGRPAPDFTFRLNERL